MYDVIVIGSGAGGLTAAVALARAGQKVLVLEQHYLPGGWCHSFTLEGYRFSPGVHYIGELGRGGMARRLYEGLGTGRDLVFCELNPEGYDHVLLGDRKEDRYDYVAGKAHLGEALAQRFPRERRGIFEYLDAVSHIGRELESLMSIDSVADALKLPFRAPSFARWLPRSAGSLIEHYVQDTRLRSVLGAQAGDHGLPPSQVPAVMHAAIQAHYFDGGYYPKGGASAIPRAFIRALRKAGGEIRVRADVTKILLEGRRAIGVRLADGTEIRAKLVVSNADPDITLRKLVGVENLSWDEKLRLRRMKWSVSALSLFMATDLDLRSMGMDSGNYWYFGNGDAEALYRRGLTAWSPSDGPIPGGFITATTLKDPSKSYGGKHTLEAFTFVSYDAFTKWAHSAYGSRPADYEANKQELQRLMLEMVGHVIPGIEKHVAFAELGTPLSNVHYCASTNGNLYGTEKSLTHIGPFAQQPKTSIENLWMCGASTLSHGVLGAQLSGLAVAGRILRCRFSDLFRPDNGEVTLVPSEHYEQWPARLRQRGARVEQEEAALG